MLTEAQWAASDPAAYLVIDLEATCDDQGTIARHEMETIEIGAVKLDEDFCQIDEFTAFVQPVRHPVLSRFCAELTTIRQEDVAAADHFPAAFQRFLDWIGAPPKWFISWGDYDRKQLQRDCEYHNISFPDWMTDRHCNLRALSAFGDARKPTLVEALEDRGMGLSGTQHRGIDDAKSTAQLVPYILGPKRFEGRLKPEKAA